MKMHDAQTFEASMGVNSQNDSLKLGRLQLDHTHIDCALIMNQYPGGCMLEVNHPHETTYCFVHELKGTVMLAFNDDVDAYSVLRQSDFAKHPRFMERTERLLLLLPEFAFEALERTLGALSD
jgi:hypothetical protein